MPRLPIPGKDSGTWGDILNGYLAQAHKPDGTLKDNIVTSNTIAPGSVTNAAIATSAVSAAQIADASITETLLHADVQTKLNAPAGTPDWDDIANKPTTFSPTAHSHAIGDLTTTGTASSSTYLRGDGAWAVIPGGAAGREILVDSQVWYVDGSTGNDGNTGLAAAPKATLAAAIAAAGDNTPVVIRINNISSISLSNIKRRNRLHIMPVDLANPPTLTSVVLSGCRAVDVRGFKVTLGMAFGSSLTSGGSHATASVDCVFAGNSIGPSTDPEGTRYAGVLIKNHSERCVVARNEINGLDPTTGNSLRGIYLFGSGSSSFTEGGTMGVRLADHLIDGNYIHGIGGDGISGYGYVSGLRVINNFITGCHPPSGNPGDHTDGMQISGGNAILIQNNAVWDTSGIGAGILCRDFYSFEGLRIIGNTVYNVNRGTPNDEQGNGIHVWNAPNAVFIDNLVYRTWGMTEGWWSLGGGLAVQQDTTGFDKPTNERRSTLASTDIVLIRNICDKLKVGEGGAMDNDGATWAIRENNWIPSANQGYLADYDLTPGDSYGAITTTQVEALATANTTDRLAREWRLDPFAYWFGAPETDTHNTVFTGHLAPARKTVNANTATAYTLQIGDAGRLVTLSNAASVTLTVPANASVAYPIGTRIELVQLGAGQVTVAGAGGVTVNTTPGLKIAARYGRAELVKLATDTWLLTGNLAA